MNSPVYQSAPPLIGPLIERSPNISPHTVSKTSVQRKTRLPRTAVAEENPRLNSHGLLPTFWQSSKPIEFNVAKFRLGFIEALGFFVSRIF